MNKGLADGLKGVTVDVGHIVGDGVPRRTKGTLLTIRIVWNDVDTWNLGHTVYGHMIVSNRYTLFLREIAAETNGLGRTPHLVYHTTGITKRLLFLIELSPLAANHIEQDAITGRITIDMRIGSPILGTKGPCVAI